MKHVNTARHGDGTLCVNGHGHGTDGTWQENIMFTALYV